MKKHNTYIIILPDYIFDISELLHKIAKSDY